MRRGWWLVCGAVACTNTSPPTAPSLAVAGQARSYVVVLDRRADPESVARGHGLTPSHVYRYALTGFAASVPEAAIEGLRRNPHVVSVSPSQRVQVFDTQANPPSWGLDRIDQAALPLDASYSAPNDGAGVRVYVLDTGVLEHTELQDRAGSGYDTIDNDTDASDCHGHGTHVAGTVAGTSVGVAKRATIIAVRMLDCDGYGSTEQVIAAIDWLIANHQKPAVVNASWGGGGVDAPLEAAVRAAVNAGITWVSAAGNSRSDACNFNPAREPLSYTVGATNANDYRADFSNFGPCLDLFAPGVDIRSLFMVGGYVAFSGTSMAAPHVAGVAALYLAAHPFASPATVGAALSASATPGVVLGAGVGSPNLLLRAQVAGAGVLAPLPRPNPSVRAIPVWVAPVHIASLAPAVGASVKGKWAAGARVRVLDGNGVPVYRYSAEFRTQDGYTALCNLDFDGWCTAYWYAPNKQRSVTFTIVHVGPGTLYDPAFNVANSVTVSKP